MKVIYIDCFSGISGDKFVSSLLDLGLPENFLLSQLKKLKLKDKFKIYIKEVVKNGIRAKSFIVEENKNISRNINEIKKIIIKSEFDNEVKNKILKMFETLYKVEKKIHKKFSHFHELGLLDTIIDITSAVIGLKYFNIEKVFSSKVNVGSGFVNTHHGSLSVPAFATAELLKGIPVFSFGPEEELTTPTGALILKELVDKFEMPEFVIKKIGYGAGSKNFENFNNVLRIFLGEIKDFKSNQKVLIETNIDNLNPEIYSYLIEKLFKNGALDVTLTPTYMKKNRPGVIISCITDFSNKDKIIKIIFEETTSIGVRIFYPERIELERTSEVVKTPYGNALVKISKYNGNVINISPEYEICKKIAEKNKIPIKKVYNIVMKSIKNI